ncbi:MAG: amidohydrolase family protein [Phycisphaerales bacterium]|nr:amidohydrolase family protein [Phycisphaerales bacterium]
MKSATIALLAGCCTIALAQSHDPLAPRPNGMSPATPAKFMIQGGTVHLSPTESIPADDSPLIVVENGKVVGINTNTQFERLDTNGYQVFRLDPDSHVYAGFIDPYIEVSTPDLPSSESGTHWSTRVTPNDNALRVGLGSGDAESLRSMGFTTAMIAPDSGIFRGWTAVVSTAASYDDPSQGNPPIHRSNAGQAMGFDRGSWGDRGYPTSHMGVVALMRQNFSDADTRRGMGDHADSNILDHINPGETTFYYDISQELEAALADDIATEFEHPSIVIVDNGTAHRRLDLFKEMGHPVIVPLRFPETPDVFSVGAMEDVDLATLQHWERAPANARWLHNAGLDVALTTSKLRSGEKFWNNLHTAIDKGLPADDALAMITTNPAQILGLEGHGTISEGAIANLVVASGDLFDPNGDAKIIDTWIDGRRHHISDVEDARFDGSWTSTIVGTELSIEIKIDGKSVTLIDSAGEKPVETKATKVSIDGNSISFLTDYKDDEHGAYIHTATLASDGTIRGTTINPAPMSFTPNPDSFEWVATPNDAAASMSDFRGTWNAVLSDEHKLDFQIGKDKITVIERVEDGDDIKQDASEFELKDGVLTFSFEHEPFGDAGTFSVALTAPDDDGNIAGMGTLPSGKGFGVVATKQEKDPDPVHTLPDTPDAPFGPFAYGEAPEQGTYILHSATVWTQSDDGILEDGWVLIRDGKVAQIGTGGYPRIAAETIDATGMHITPGLIDAHSHTGLFRFGVNESGQAVTSEVRIADSIDPAHPGYYRELAGGLTSSLLLHGSANPIGGQSQTIKLRWDSDKPRDMYFEDSKPGIKFALGENVKQSNWSSDGTRYPQTRLGVETLMRDRFIRAQEYAARGNKTEAGYRDIELETLAQILAGDRLIHCHSYRQDEILMLCRLAEEFGFKIGTFQHGLETYKVAEVVKEHAIGASIFSDWWAYKYEVVDAIPFAGPINHEVGLLTSFNSDSDDVARRMNVEAGKALKYAKLSGIEMTEQEALNFVTLNPAKQLMIDDRVGSLEQGKDADVVVWTGNPLSSLSRPEMTFVDGRLLFSRDLDAQMRQRDAAERQRLIQLIIRDGKPLEESDKPDTHEHDHDHAEPDHNHDHHFNTARGECGCGDTLPAFHTGY